MLGYNKIRSFVKLKAKSTYVNMLRCCRSLAASTKLLVLLERYSDSRIVLWFRSLFAIYDIGDMVKLDLAWWTFGAMEYLEADLYIREKAEVFEYGSGASTVWLAKRAKNVIAVEHSREWKHVVDMYVKDLENVEVHLVEAQPDEETDRWSSEKEGHSGLSFERYVKTIEQFPGEFDVIVIDGRCRVECFGLALKRLRNDGVIVFDNSSRSRYRRAIERSHCWTIKCRGLTPGLPYGEETTLVFRSERAWRAALSRGGHAGRYGQVEADTK